MLNLFRAVSLLEGCSFLLLLFVAMPAKYVYGIPAAVTWMGWIHGGLFMLYLLIVMDVSTRCRWSRGLTAFATMASMLPFACFFMEFKLRQLSSATMWREMPH